MTPRLSAAATLFVREAAKGLLNNRLRSVLAAISITIGIAALICVVAIGQAGSRRAEEQLRNLGENYIQIEAGARAPNGVRTGSHGTTSLLPADYEAIVREVPLIKRGTPNVDGRVQVVFGDRNWSTRWRGVNTGYFDVRRWPVDEGAAFGDEDVRRASSVCLLGRTVREKLFGDGPAVGQVVRMGAQLFQVVGVLSPKGQSPTGQDQDDAVILPWTTAQQKLRGRGQIYLDDILLSAVSPEAVGPATAQIVDLLRERHHLRPGADDDFNVRRPDEVLKAQVETSNTLEALLVGIAAISLVVGGIGVMNVMLVSVTERMREIGLRLAVGATGRDVQLQFLGEAAMLTLFGGLLGIVLGALACAVIGALLGWQVLLPATAVAVGPAVAVAVGLAFGFYPARRASRLDPIDALRHE